MSEIPTVTGELLESFMHTADDIKKEFKYSKDTGQWHWHDKDEEEWLHGPHNTFWDCLFDAVEPYFSEEAEG